MEQVASVVQYMSVGQCESNRGGLGTGSYLRHRFHTAQREYVQKMRLLEMELCVVVMKPTPLFKRE
jgi:hypothetical protein